MGANRRPDMKLLLLGSCPSLRLLASWNLQDDYSGGRRARVWKWATHLAPWTHATQAIIIEQNSRRGRVDNADLCFQWVTQFSATCVVQVGSSGFLRRVYGFDEAH